MKVSCVRSSASSRSRTMRKMSENTGRSYRRISSRCAASRPSRARATTSASGRFARSRAWGIGRVGSRAGRHGAPRASRIRTYPRCGAQSSVALARALDAGELSSMHVTEVEERVAEAAAEGGAEKRAYVRTVFEQIAPRYDLLNHLLSLNIDRLWRRRALAALGVDARARGTLPRSVRGNAGRRRGAEPRGRDSAASSSAPTSPCRCCAPGAGKAPPSVLAPVAADALQLPLADGSMQGATWRSGSATSRRSIAALREVHRVLAPGGRFVILEFTTPRVGASCARSITSTSITCCRSSAA